MPKVLFLIRHAAYEGEGDDPELSDFGREQATQVGKKIARYISGLQERKSIQIWTSTAKRAAQTALQIQQEQQRVNFLRKEKLWSDDNHKEDFPWLQVEVAKSSSDVLIIVSHFEYVRLYPEFIGFNANESGYAEGVIITTAGCEPF